MAEDVSDELHEGEDGRWGFWWEVGATEQVVDEVSADSRCLVLLREWALKRLEWRTVSTLYGV